MKASLAAFATGVLFAAGLAVGGMTDPSKVAGFLDVAGAWDPSLALVMAGAIGVYAPLQRLIRRRRGPLLGGVFAPLTKTRVDSRLLVGSGLFGIGWGLSGYCPGPALTTLGSGGFEPLMFTGAMLAGIALHDLAQRIERVWTATQADAPAR